LDDRFSKLVYGRLGGIRAAVYWHELGTKLQAPTQDLGCLPCLRRRGPVVVRLVSTQDYIARTSRNDIFLRNIFRLVASFRFVARSQNPALGTMALTRPCPILRTHGPPKRDVRCADEYGLSSDRVDVLVLHATEVPRADTSTNDDDADGLRHDRRL
jgi:hypothetical protein